MAGLGYELNFGDIPFVSDWGRKIQLNKLENDERDFFAGSRQQPEPNLLKELDRIIPFRWLQDFAPPSARHGPKLNALATSWNVDPEPKTTSVSIGEWFYPYGASRWSVARFLCPSSFVKDLTTLTKGGLEPKTFKMMNVPVIPSNAPDTSYTIETSMYAMPPRPLAELGGSFDGLYLVTLVDDRWFFQNTPASLTVSRTTTWSDLLSSLGTALGITINLPVIETVYGQPEPDSQFWTRVEDAAFLLDAVAANVGRVVVRNFNGTYSLLTWEESITQVESNRGTPGTVDRIAGGDMLSSGTSIPAGTLTSWKNAISPTTVRVAFPKYVFGADPVPHFYNPRYDPSGRPSAWYEDSFGDTFNVDIPISSGGARVSGVSGIGTIGFHSLAKAMLAAQASVSPDNASGLTALALQLAKNYYTSVAGAALDEVYPGTKNWTPEGINDILWTYSEDRRLASTRVMRSEWNTIIKEFQHGTPGDTLASGIGGRSVAQTISHSGGGIAFGVNFVEFYGPGVGGVSGQVFSGGISKAQVLIQGGGGASGPISSGYVSSYSSGVLTSGYHTALQVPQVQIARYMFSGGVIIRSISSGETARVVEIMNVSPLPSPGEAPSTGTYLNEDTTGTSPGDRISTPDGLPVVQQPQETVRLKYTDSRWKFAERLPGPPYTVQGGGGTPYIGRLSSGDIVGVSGVYVDYSVSGPPQIMRSGCMPASNWICSGTVDWSILGSGAANSGKLGDGAVNSGNIASGAIDYLHMSSGFMLGVSGIYVDFTVSGPPQVMRSGTLGSGYLSSGNVGWPHLSSGTVRSGHIADTAVNSGNVASGQLTWPHFSSGYLEAQSGLLIDYSQGPPKIGIAVPTTSGTANAGQFTGGKFAGSVFVSGFGIVVTGSRRFLSWSGVVAFDVSGFRQSGFQIMLPANGMYQINYSLLLHNSGAPGNVNATASVWRLPGGSSMTDGDSYGFIASGAGGSGIAAFIGLTGSCIMSGVSGLIVTVGVDNNGAGTWLAPCLSQAGMSLVRLDNASPL